MFQTRSWNLVYIVWASIIASCYLWYPWILGEDYQQIVFLDLLSTFLFLYGTILGCRVYRALQIVFGTRHCYGDPQHLNTGLPHILKAIQKESVVNPKKDTLITGSKLMDDELRQVIKLVLRDYMQEFWLPYITKEPTCSPKAEDMLQQILAQLANYVKEVDAVALLTGPATDVFLSHLHFYRQAFGRARTTLKESPPTLEEEERRNLMNQELVLNFLQLEGSHRFLTDEDGKVKEDAYLRELCELFLFAVLPNDSFRNTALRYMFREVLAVRILQPSTDRLCDPDFINQTLEWLLQSEAQSFPRFLRTIDTCNDIADVKFMHSKVIKAIHKLNNQIKDMHRARHRGVDQQVSSISVHSNEVVGGAGGLIGCNTSGLEYTPIASGLGREETKGMSIMNLTQRLNRLKQADTRCRKQLQYLKKKSGMNIPSLGPGLGWDTLLMEETESEGGADRRAEGHVSPSPPSPDLGDNDDSIKVEDDDVGEGLDDPDRGWGRHAKLGDVLLNDVMCSAFTAFVQGDPLAVQALQVWQVIEDFRAQISTNAMSDKEDLKATTEMVRRHLHGPILDILSPESVEGTMKATHQGLTSGIFIQIQQELFDYLEVHVYPLFLRSPSFDGSTCKDTICLDQPVEVEALDSPFSPRGKPVLSPPLLDSRTPSAEHSGRRDNWSQGSLSARGPRGSDSLRRNDTLVWKVQMLNIEQVVNEDGHLTVYYLLRVTRTDCYGDIVDIIRRRYNAFHDLHMQLQHVKEPMTLPDLPPKRAFGNLSLRFLQDRAKDLNIYIQDLLCTQYVTKNEECARIIANFLSPGAYAQEYTESARKIDSIWNFFSLGKPGVQDSDSQIFTPNFFHNQDSMFLDEENDEDNIPFHILLMAADEVFDFSSHSCNALRNRFRLMVRYLVSTYMGSLINTHIMATMADLFSAQQIAKYIRLFRESFWPNDVLAGAGPKRDSKQKSITYHEARARLVASIPEQAKKYVGGPNCRQGVLHCFDMLQHPLLNRRLSLALLECMLAALLPDLNVPHTVHTLLEKANHRPAPHTERV